MKVTAHVFSPRLKVTTHVLSPGLKVTTHVLSPRLKVSTHVLSPGVKVTTHVTRTEGYHTCIVTRTEGYPTCHLNWRLPHMYCYLDWSLPHMYCRLGWRYNTVTSDLWQGAAPPLSTWQLAARLICRAHMCSVTPHCLHLFRLPATQDEIIKKKRMFSFRQFAPPVFLILNLRSQLVLLYYISKVKIKTFVSTVLLCVLFASVVAVWFTSTLMQHDVMDDKTRFATKTIVIICNRVYCIHVPGHEPITFSFQSFSFLIGWVFYSSNYLRC